MRISWADAGQRSWLSASNVEARLPPPSRSGYRTPSQKNSLAQKRRMASLSRPSIPSPGAGLRPTDPLWQPRTRVLFGVAAPAYDGITTHAGHTSNASNASNASHAGNQSTYATGDVHGSRVIHETPPKRGVCCRPTIGEPPRRLFILGLPPIRRRSSHPRGNAMRSNPVYVTDYT